MFEAQRIEIHCGRCGAHWVAMCSTGNVRSHIARFGVVHLHRDPFDAPSE
jgi:peptide methionine sulfoxide reductase MsrB